MHGRDEILSLIPHQGTMCLLDEVVEWDETRVLCRTRSHARADNPLRDAAGLRAVHLCEYGAQAMAVHGGLLAREHGGRARPGLLVSLRGVKLHAGRVDALPDALDVEAEQLMAGEDSWQYAFRIHHQGQLLAEGRAAVMMAPQGIDSNGGQGHG
jgi:predicted hotdog family 3-hydroxylacyl-ACP dehydratase